jgi:protein required for attachment to host cells
MMLPKGAIVAVADGEKVNLFRNVGDEAGLKLAAMPALSVNSEGGTSNGHQSSSGNPDRGQADEDGFSAGIVQFLNRQVLSGEIAELVIVSAPRALGEMRKHYHKALSSVLRGEIAKDLTGHSLLDIEKAISAA